MAIIPSLMRAGGAAAVAVGLAVAADWVVRRDPGVMRVWREAVHADRVFGTPNAPPGEHALGVAFAPDGRCVATGARGGTVTVRTAAGDPLLTWQAHAEPVYALCFLADSSTLLSAGWGGELRVWTLAAGGPVLRATGRGDGPVLAVAASPDGTAVAAGSTGRVAVWRLEADRLAPVAEFAAPPYPTNALAFSADGRSVAAGNSGDGRAWVWRLSGPAEPERFDTSPEYQIRGLHFTPDGWGLLTVDSEGAVARADADGPARLGRLRGPTVRQAAFSPDGRDLIVAHLDGTARLTHRD